MRDVSRRMMRASTSFAEGKTLLSPRALSKSSKKIDLASRGVHSQCVALFFSLVDGSVDVFFSTARSKERKRGGRFSAPRDRKKERERERPERRIRLLFLHHDPLSFSLVLERAHQKRAKNRFRPMMIVRKPNLLPVLLPAE